MSNMKREKIDDKILSELRALNSESFRRKLRVADLEMSKNDELKAIAELERKSEVYQKKLDKKHGKHAKYDLQSGMALVPEKAE